MKKRIIAILTALIILTILFIFSNSLRPVEQSVTQSSRVVDIIVRVFKLSDNVDMDSFHPFIRKAAHFTEYFVLGAEIFLLIYQIQRKYFGKLTFIPFVAVFETACIDEFIQSFSDRGDSFKDVLLDFSGGICGAFFTILIIMIIGKIIYKIKHKKPKNQRKKQFQFSKIILRILNIFPEDLMILQNLRKFFNSIYFYFAVFVFEAVMIWLDMIVGGAVAIVFMVLFLLIICDNLSALLMPLLIMSSTLVKCFDSYDRLIHYWWLSIPLCLCFAAHFIIYKKPFFIGKSFWGIVGVAIAITCGGAFSISRAEYFNGTAMYHVIALGIGMVLFYLIAKQDVSSLKGNDFFSKFALIMYMWGLFCCYMVIQHYLMNISELKETLAPLNFQWSNNISTMMMFAMPFAFYFCKKNMFNFAGGLLIYSCLILTGSRGGLLFGSIEVLICLIYCFFICKKIYARIIIVAIPVILAIIVRLNLIDMKIFMWNTLFGTEESLIRPNETRYKLIWRSFNDFRSNIIFGKGLGYSGNTDLYDPAKGSLHFYHMMIPQIIGSMGLVGILAYGYQIIGRIKLLLKKIDAYTMCLGISYLGIFMMSQVNPGEFCPLPYELVAILLFIVIEEYVKRKPFAVKESSKI